jgi:hypothetical protein
MLRGLFGRQLMLRDKPTDLRDSERDRVFSFVETTD